ncbi:SusC/RagA family TonB-linked outer membrane protein [Myroides marinus]|uniref:SusC/RagA family TonB-linked outer membrane protein n=1 Tax=Myroides marinus TaxID=703342 RepID=UPI002577DEAD|nr:SusC/RagA family TonB-linked outer membrane protein [Myroides marinus]MDM1352417.1 SusC/RagA family TonB-linked outer membrane protein [Myroides marinus]MDM1353211.1 SusC/RagA family TonB-linked outer membrane protein [Myroides marinus]MDM1359622.1 SusC/RagA family TonB-linked outer membrane protein [Myroides marinus]MDM1366751.1 SusC/RagA family TonB-linked outer membrane protein [Myroides marinus]MDM1533948.1 SusC/RagA family TonB-linked outer membrane protein [Myroides marinus]
MKTQILTFFGCRKAIPLLFFVGLLSSPIYAVSNDKHLFFSVSDLQQDTKQKPTIKLSGTVKDSFGALGGVIVTVGTKVVTTDLDGKYTTYITYGDKITFSMMGYKDQSIVYSGGSSLNITLSEDNSTLDEIVVNAGYYSVKDRERTGSIARVTAKDIEFQPVVNPLQAIQGRVAGVDITQNSGVAGGGMNIEIRGRNFLDTSIISARNTPMYIVDGVPFLSNALGKANGNLGVQMFENGISPLNSINPSDIESIEILKDADATAIYGSRGANGVVLITTKKGKSDKTRFTFSSSIGFSKVAKFLDMMNTQQYIQMREEAFKNSGITTYPVNAHDINGTWDKNRYTNWQKELIGDTAIDQSIALGIQGGNEYTNYNINLSKNENTTVFPTDKGYKRSSALINFNHKSKNNKLQINTSTSYSEQNNNLPTVDITQQAINLAPNAPSLYDKQGNLNWENGSFNNPLAQLKQSYENNTQSLILNTNLSYKLLPNLFFKTNAGMTKTDFEEWKIVPHTIYNPALNYTSEKSNTSKSNNNFKSFIVEPQLQYLKEIGKHSIDILVGATYQTTTTSGTFIRGVGFSSDALIKNIGAAKQKVIGSTTNAEYKYVALFTRLNYMYDNKYILNLTARRDGSSRFAKENKFGNFGAIGAAWLFSQESFMENLPWLSFGKLRTSYGVTGSDNIGDYAYLDTYSIISNQYNDETGLTPTSLYNPNYKWEKTTKFETALELSFLKSRINTTVAFYNNRSTDQLIGLTLPSTTGFNSIVTNSPAVVDNKGWEFTLNTDNLKSNTWKWTTNFNISFPKNKLVSYPGLEKGTQSSYYVVGEPLNIVKLYQYNGLNPETGLYEFTDYNNDGKIDINDKMLVKSLNPQFYGGLQNTISYKNFTLDFLFYFKKQENYNFNKNHIIPGAAIINLPVDFINRWRPDNPNATYIGASFNDAIAASNEYPYTESDATISDASYIRLKNLSFAYSLKIPKSKIESLRLYIQGQNLWTITSFKGMDPEFTTSGYLPPLCTYSFGMQLIF